MEKSFIDFNVSKFEIRSEEIAVIQNWGLHPRSEDHRILFVVQNEDVFQLQFPDGRKVYLTYVYVCAIFGIHPSRNQVRQARLHHRKGEHNAQQNKDETEEQEKSYRYFFKSLNDN